MVPRTMRTEPPLRQETATTTSPNAVAGAAQMYARIRSIICRLVFGSIFPQPVTLKVRPPKPLRRVRSKTFQPSPLPKTKSCPFRLIAHLQNETGPGMLGQRRGEHAQNAL